MADYIILWDDGTKEEYTATDMTDVEVYAENQNTNDVHWISVTYIGE